MFGIESLAFDSFFAKQGSGFALVDVMAVGAGFDPVGVVPTLGFEVLMEPFQLDAFLLNVAFGAGFLDGFPMPDFDFVPVFANLMAFGARVRDVFKLMLIESFPRSGAVVLFFVDGDDELEFFFPPVVCRHVNVMTPRGDVEHGEAGGFALNVFAE